MSEQAATHAPAAVIQQPEQVKCGDHQLAGDSLLAELGNLKPDTTPGVGKERETAMEV
jgi:hypothetical protein